MTHGCFKELPAISRWFKRSHQQDQPLKLDLSYLEQFGDAIVPLELNSNSDFHPDQQNTPFHRSEAPLSIFLRWAESADAHSPQRLYLAQASISDLPEQLRNDLPTPKFVSDAGKGDIYDTNLWLGVAPTYTPLHRDPNPNLFVQLAGRKIVRLLPPEAGQEIFSAVVAALGRDASTIFRGDEMMHGDEKRLLEDQIWCDRDAGKSSGFPGHETSLSSGDGLFIPKGWWHSIKGVGAGITGPQKDMGYDIADYKAIDKLYGTIDDVDQLIVELKSRDMKLMMDLVHEWFLSSRSSRDSDKRNWYIWKPPSGYDDDGNPLPPNNWSQLLGEANSAWTYDSITKEFFLSLFTPGQPDLNWENPDVRAAVHDVMCFWLERGACGYRMDVINLISKDQRFPDAPLALGRDKKYHPGGKYYVNGPRMHEYLREIHDKVLVKHNAITVGEMPVVSDIDEIIKTVGRNSGELNMIFIFDLVGIDDIPDQVRMTLQPWGVKDIRRIVNKWQRAMLDHDGWNSVFCENHDSPRSVSRYTDDSDKYRHKGAKLLALMQTTLCGTLFVYQGEELGMRNVPKSWDIEKEYKDIESINFWKKSKELYGGDPKRLAEERKVLEKKARDHARTPMQWSAEPNAGFCAESILPWMRVNDDYHEVNVEKQMALESKDDLSVWQYWQRGLANRQEHKDVFVYGDYQTVGAEGNDVFAYVRIGSQAGKWLVVLNFSGKEVEWDLPLDIRMKGWVAGNYQKGKPEKAVHGKVQLKPWEGILGNCIQ
ncbi:MAG: hypothetical protein Q9195_002272 [Heterodermia aff. obscurata]